MHYGSREGPFHRGRYFHPSVLPFFHYTVLPSFYIYFYTSILRSLCAAIYMYLTAYVDGVARLVSWSCRSRCHWWPITVLLFASSMGYLYHSVSWRGYCKAWTFVDACIYPIPPIVQLSNFMIVCAERMLSRLDPLGTLQRKRLFF